MQNRYHIQRYGSKTQRNYNYIVLQQAQIQTNYRQERKEANEL